MFRINVTFPLRYNDGTQVSGIDLMDAIDEIVERCEGMNYRNKTGYWRDAKDGNKQYAGEMEILLEIDLSDFQDVKWIESRRANWEKVFEQELIYITSQTAAHIM